jgi:hypothetical protein
VLGVVIVEIGSNDGSVLDIITERGFKAVGFDPSAKGMQSLDDDIFVIKDYFSEKTSKNYAERYGNVDLVVTRHTMEHNI